MALIKDNSNLKPVNVVEEEVQVAADNALAPAEETKTRTKDKEKIAFYKNFKKQGKALLEEEKQSGAAENAGSMSDKVAYLHALGNPTKKGTRTEKGVSGIATIDVVGYAFKALANIKVPVVDRKGLPKNNVMGVNSVTWVDVKKGDTFLLSRAELGEMITLNEYSGVFSGDPKNVVELQVTVSKVTGGKYAPTTILKKSSTDSAPIKAHIVPIATKIKGATGNGIKDYEVLPEYAEKFGYLFEEVKSVGRSGGTKEYQKRAPGESAAELAAAIRAYKKRAEMVQ